MLGSLRTIPLPGAARPAATRLVYLSTQRYTKPSTAGTKKMPVANVIAVTWISSQYDCSAGTGRRARYRSGSRRGPA